MIGRNPMELMRLLPGVVAPDQDQMADGRQVRLGALDTGSYGVNGVRGRTWW